MKTIKYLLLATVMLTAITTQAAEIEITSAARVTTLQFSNVKKGQQLTIKDAANFTLYTEVINGSGTYAKKFDLSALSDGEYVIELSKDCEIVVKAFQIKLNQIIISQNSEYTFFKPTIRMDNNKLMVSQLSLSSSPLELELYYKGALIHTDQIKGSAILSRAYQLSPLEKGSYTVVMTSQNRQYVKNFTI